MPTLLPTRLQRACRWLPLALLPLLSLAAQAQTLGYTASNATNSGGTYTDLGTAGTAIATANADDANSAAQDIGFAFSFNGQTFTQFVLNTNGLLKLGGTPPSTAALYFENFAGGGGTDPLGPAAGAADVNLLMPFNLDLRPGTGPAEYRVATTGTAPNQVCTVQWKNLSDKPEPANGAPSQYANFSFQAKLFQNGNIEFVYDAATPTANATATRFPNVGLKGSSTANNNLVLALKDMPGTPWSATTFINQNYGTQAHDVNKASVPDAGHTYRFAPGAGCADPTAATIGNVTNTSVQISFTPGAGNVSYNVTYTPTGGATQTLTPAPTASPVTVGGLTPGTTYALTLQSVCAGGAVGSVLSGAATTTGGTAPPPPANDDPAGALALPLAASCTPTTGTNAGATTTPPAGYVNPGCGIALNPKDVWYKFTTAATGAGSTYVAIQVTGTPAGQVRVFSAPGNAGPFTEIGCAAGANNNTAAGPLRVSSLAPNTTYYVFVSGYGSGDATGPFTICATALATPPTPPYATLPYSESFEGPWLDALAVRDVPTLNWRNTPATGDNSWRREDDGFASANWRFQANEMPTASFPTPPYATRFSTGAHSARFHTFGSAAGAQGRLDLYVNLSGAGSKTLTFDYINPTGADKVDVLVSTDGGATFGTPPVLTATTSPAFAAKTVAIASSSATTVIRFQATSDFGSDDLGLDNLQLRVVTATRNEALAATVGLTPNPAHQRFVLAVPAGPLPGATATLLNALGQVVQQRRLDLPAAGGTAEFDVSRLAPGVYSLQLKTGTDLVVKRVVVE